MTPTITTVKPRTPYPGELWFDSRSMQIKVFDGVEWTRAVVDENGELVLDETKIPLDIKAKIGKLL